MTFAEAVQYIPNKHTLLLMYVAGIITWKLTPFLRAMREACSEKPTDGTRGKVSIKRIIPMIFTLLVCYMVIGYTRGKGVFNDTAFWGLIGFIALSASIITVTQATSIMDKINSLKIGVLNTKTEETSVQKKTEVTQAT
jgi:hypothetical protein